MVHSDPLSPTAYDTLRLPSEVGSLMDDSLYGLTYDPVWHPCLQIGLIYGAI